MFVHIFSNHFPILGSTKNENHAAIFMEDPPYDLGPLAVQLEVCEATKTNFEFRLVRPTQAIDHQNIWVFFKV